MTKVYAATAEDQKFCSERTFILQKSKAAQEKMSSPHSSKSHSPDETRTQDSIHGSSQYGAVYALEDTASSVYQGRDIQTVTRVSGGTFPNSAYSRGRTAARSKLASPRPRRILSPVGLSVAQRRVQLAEQTVATAISGVGRVAEESRRVRKLVGAATAKARSVRGEVESRVAQMAAAAEASAARSVEHVAAEVEQVAAYNNAQASRVAADVTARLEHEVQAAATSTVATAELMTRTVVEGVRREIQAQLDSNRADALRRSEEAAAQVRELSVQLASLTEQLNKINPISGKEVDMGYAQVVSDVDKRFAVQQEEIKTLSTAILEQQKSLQSNNETLHSVLTGVENLGENVKNLQEEMVSWQTEYQEGEEDYEKMKEQLLQEVPLAPERPEPTVKINLPEVTTFRNKVPENPIPHMPTIHEEAALPGSIQQPVQGFFEKQNQEIQDRWRNLTKVSGSVKPPEIKYTDGQWVPASQSTIPQFFGSNGSKARVAKESQPVTDRTPRRINPTRVDEADVSTGKPSVRFADQNDVMNETTATSEGTQSIIGRTTISSHEAQKIKEDVRAVMRKQFAEGRAALRADLGLPVEEVSTSGKAASAGAIDLVSSSVHTGGNSVPRTSFGSPIPVTNPGFASPSVTSGAQPFATAAWKPKEPPCFFGLSTEDAHTWVSLVRNYLTFMSGSDAQQVAYTATLFREAAHEWYMLFECRNRGPPRDWAMLVAALLDRFGSNIRSQEAQSQVMSISQGSRAVRDYASQFETLLGRLDSYDEGHMLNLFIWGLQPDLARSVSLHYPQSIAKAVLLAETTELAIKASRRPGWKSSTAGNPTKGQNQKNCGQGQWRGRGWGRGGYRGRGGSSSIGSARGNARGRGGNSRGQSYSVNYDPLACFRCGVRGHLARDCPQKPAQS